MKTTTEPAYDSTPETLQHIARVAELLADISRRLIERGSVHDASKLREPEKPIFDVCTPRLKGLVYGSPEYQESLRDLQPALLHHYANNTHHPEHFPNGIAGMSLLDLVEMFCDWKAAGERHADGGCIDRSLAVNAKRFSISPQLERILRNTAHELAWLRSPQNRDCQPHCEKRQEPDFMPVGGDYRLRLPTLQVPWKMIAPHNAQAVINHIQTLVVLRSKGGLEASEAIAILEDRKWFPMDPENAYSIVKERIEKWIASQEEKQ